MNQQNTNLINAAAAGEMLGVSMKTIRKMTCEKRIPCVRISRRCTRYSPEALSEWIKSKEVPPES